MKLRRIFQCWLCWPKPAAVKLPRSSRQRLHMLSLEDRTVPNNYTAAGVSDLIADVNAANASGGANTITLVAGTTFTLAAVNNTTDGPTGLPVVQANDSLTIVGSGD